MEDIMAFTRTNLISLEFVSIVWFCLNFMICLNILFGGKTLHKLRLKCDFFHAFDYCNFHYIRISKSNMNRLQSEQNAAARLLTGSQKFDFLYLKLWPDRHLNTSLTLIQIHLLDFWCLIWAKLTLPRSRLKLRGDRAPFPLLGQNCGIVSRFLSD